MSLLWLCRGMLFLFLVANRLAVFFNSPVRPERSHWEVTCWVGVTPTWLRRHRWATRRRLRLRPTTTETTRPTRLRLPHPPRPLLQLPRRPRPPRRSSLERASRPRSWTCASLSEHFGQSLSIPSFYTSTFTFALDRSHTPSLGEQRLSSIRSCQLVRKSLKYQVCCIALLRPPCSSAAGVALWCLSLASLLAPPRKKTEERAGRVTWLGEYKVRG